LKPGLAAGLGDAAAFGRARAGLFANATVPAIPTATTAATTARMSNNLFAIGIPMGSSQDRIRVGAICALPSWLPILRTRLELDVSF
jgi:hypothetical protein